MLAIDFWIAADEPWPISTIAITAATPIITPSAVNNDRILLRRSALSALRSVEIPAPAAIDYYGMIDTATGPATVGDSVVFGFRPQAFVTRANVVGLAGVAGSPVVETISDAYGRPVAWPL